MNELCALPTVLEFALTEHRKHAETINPIPLEKAIGAVAWQSAKEHLKKSY